MELRDLRAFTAVVDAGGVTRAAEHLGLVQSAVSQTVKRLERELDLQLLERRRDGVRPTEAGAALDRHARLILHSVARAGADMAAFHGLRRGQLRLGILHTAVPMLLAPLLRRIAAAHPGLHVRVQEGMADDLVDQLALRVVDLAVIFLPAELPAFGVHELARVPLAAVVHPEHPAAGNGPIRLEALADERWISFPPDNPGRVWLEGSCAAAGFVPEPVLEVDTLSHLKTFVEAGVGITLMPTQACELERRLGSLVAVDVVSAPQVTLAYVLDPQRPSGMVLEAVRPLLEDAARELEVTGPS